MISSNFASESSSEDRSVRDLMGLLLLPALWAERDGATILQIMTEALERIVPLQFSYAQVTSLPDQISIAPMRVNCAPAKIHERLAWKNLAATWKNSRDADGRIFTADTPLGTMRVLRLSIGYGQYGGHIWFGSSAPDFPTTSQMAFLRAAISLAGTGLQTAHISYEREEASRAKDEFLAMLGHELRNPLAPIVTALSLLKAKSKDEIPREYFIIDRQVGHLRRLVDDLLDVSRITRGNVELQKKPVDLKMILARAVEDVHALVEERQHSLKLSLVSAKTWVMGDETRLTQVFTNLLTNAAKYTDPGGEITVSLLVNGNELLCEVKDNGSGISPRLFPRLFNIFEQGAATIDRAKGGLGIGLALVKNFIERHDGTVTANSKGIGLGSTFSVKLPLIKQIEEPLVTPSPVPTAMSRQCSILIVDDNIDALQTMQSCLLMQGHRVEAATNALEALDIVNRFQPTVALLDIGLPGMDGYELAARLRQKFPAADLRIFALTGYGQLKDRQKSAAAGFNGHFVKPIALEELFAALNR